MRDHLFVLSHCLISSLFDFCLMFFQDFFSSLTHSTMLRSTNSPVYCTIFLARLFSFPFLQKAQKNYLLLYLL